MDGFPVVDKQVDTTGVYRDRDARAGLDNIAADLVEDASELNRSVLDAPLQPVVPDEIWAAGGHVRDQ